ncbi:MAG: hypothetical protein ACK4PR_10635 [Gammaproteobacteria bacterium]
MKAISGKGAFSRFKQEINELGITNEWYQYRDACYKEYLVDWCEENELEVE